MSWSGARRVISCRPAPAAPDGRRAWRKIARVGPSTRAEGQKGRSPPWGRGSGSKMGSEVLRGASPAARLLGRALLAQFGEPPLGDRALRLQLRLPGGVRLGEDARAKEGDPGVVAVHGLLVRG